LYHAGDTGLTMEMKLLEQEQVDLAMLPIGGNYVMDIDDAVRAVEIHKAKEGSSNALRYLPCNKGRPP